MIRTLSILAFAALLAEPAMAQQVTVNLAGKDDQTIHADIHKAAVRVCSAVYLSDRVAEFHDKGSCVAQAEADGLAQARSIQPVSPAGSALASLGAVASTRR